MVVVFDRAGSIVSSWSPTHLDERYGINTKDQLTLDAMLSPVEVEIKKRQIEHVFTTGVAIRDRYNTQMPGGGFWHDITLSPMWDAAGRVSAVVGFIRDITDLMRAEWQLRNVRDRSLLYLDIMGHDLRNQLQVILGSTTLLQERTSDPVATELLEQAVSAAEKCAKIISKVKDTEDIFSTPIQTRSLTLALRRCIDALRSIYPEVQVEESYLVEDAKVPADDFLEHLLWNVVENAFEHNPEDRKTVWITLREQDEGYEVSIADNGHGIPDKVKWSLFDMSRRYGGVGLHQSKQIVEKYGGLIHVIDRVPGEPGQGAEFRIWLPRAHGTAFDWRESETLA
jgi:signal transduction histidine kinase